MNLEFSSKIPHPPKKTRISNFMKIRPVGAELFHMDEQTDRQHDEANIYLL